MKTLGTKLFIDDRRIPPDNSWMLAKTSAKAIEILWSMPFPQEISFDHDLGGDDTAMKVVNWIIDAWRDGTVTIPDNFTFEVHSSNPPGSDNIKAKMNNFLDMVRGEKKITNGEKEPQNCKTSYILVNLVFPSQSQDLDINKAAEIMSYIVDPMKWVILKIGNGGGHVSVLEFNEPLYTYDELKEKIDSWVAETER